MYKMIVSIINIILYFYEIIPKKIIGKNQNIIHI